MHKVPLKAASQKMVSQNNTYQEWKMDWGITVTTFGICKQITSHPVFLWKWPQSLGMFYTA